MMALPMSKLVQELLQTLMQSQKIKNAEIRQRLY
jgi:hypothetical protein